MTWWRRRQLTLVALILASIALVAFAVWGFVKPAPSCSDGKKNQNELGVDCGGVCSKVCAFEAKALLPLWTRIFKITDNSYSVVAYIENLNSHLGTPLLPYAITVVDQNGQVLTKREGDIFVNNRERFTIFESNFIFSKDVVPTRAFISFPTDNWQYVKNDLPKITIRQKNFENVPYPRLEAEIVNDSVYDLVNIPVTVVLADASGKALGASFTMVDTLGRGTKEPIFFTWPESFEESPALFDFYPHLNGFDLK